MFRGKPSQSETQTDEPPPNWIVGFLVLGVFICIALISSLEKAYASTVLFGIFCAIVQTKWKSRHHIRFWAILLLLFIPPAIVITVIDFPHIEARL